MCANAINSPVILNTCTCTCIKEACQVTLQERGDGEQYLHVQYTAYMYVNKKSPHSTVITQ